MADKLADEEVELAAEGTVLDRLETLGKGQAHIFDKISTDRRIFAAVAFVALIAAVLFANAYFNQRDTVTRLETVVAQQQDQTNQILAARTQARVGLCKNLETFATGHDRFVEQVIQERRDIIAATLANPNMSEAQKQASVAFFQTQIEAYKANIVPTYDCSDPAVVADIFKP